MSYFVALFLGLIQGLTEFLPISSSGHLVLFQNIFGLKSEMNILFDVVLHLGTLFAVVVVYRKSIWDLLKHPFSKKMKMLVLGTIPTVVIAFLFKDFFENAFGGSLLFVGFLATALLLLLASNCDKKNIEPKRMGYSQIAVMGIFQGLAIFPGLSRSGSTTTSALVLGVNKEEALEYSFLLSIPIILASLAYELIFAPVCDLSVGFGQILVGFCASLIFGILSIKLMKKTIKNNSYKYFSVYLIILSIFLILNQFWLKLF
ncbi:MAG: undecaprenyl-diphosphate phosphatase [Christensenellales bacterium]